MKKTPLKDMWFYAIGDGGVSIASNGINNFAMIFYTQMLGMSAALTGLALAVTTLWDAISDPLMGYISDNTRSKYGRRHGYMAIGGLLLAIFFVFIWIVPPVIKTNTTSLFFYILLINLIFKTATTIFIVPFAALGFEICSNYEERSKLQGIKYFFNMVINFIFGAFAWILFFKDGVDNEGNRIDGALIGSNYLRMAIILAIVALILTWLATFLTRKYIIDSRKADKGKVGIKGFFKETIAVLTNTHARKVFLFLAIAQLGMIVTSQLQIFAYVDFMQFNEVQKTFVHGSTMVGFALGSLLTITLVQHIEKKSVALIGAIFSLFSGLILYFLFIAGATESPATGTGVSGTTLFFAFSQFLYWAGSGIIIPTAASMIADISGIHKHQTGEYKDGSYSAIFSFILKAASSLGMLITGMLLTTNGYQEGVGMQEFSIAKSIVTMMIIIGPGLSILSILNIIKYPINRQYVEELMLE